MKKGDRVFVRYTSEEAAMSQAIPYEGVGEFVKNLRLGRRYSTNDQWSDLLSIEPHCLVVCGDDEGWSCFPTRCVTP